MILPAEGHATTEPFGPAVGAVGGAFALAVLSLVVSHGTSYVVTYLGRGEDRSLSPLAQMQQPYGRVVVLHVTILGGGLFAMFLGHPLLSLALLVAPKTGFDVTAHRADPLDAKDPRQNPIDGEVTATLPMCSSNMISASRSTRTCNLARITDQAPTVSFL